MKRLVVVSIRWLAWVLLAALPLSIHAQDHLTGMSGAARVMIFYGTADNNVHPNNSLEFIKARQRARKSFEVRVGPDEGHAAVNCERMMEFFIENLVMK